MLRGLVKEALLRSVFGTDFKRRVRKGKQINYALGSYIRKKGGAGSNPQKKIFIAGYG